MHHPPFSRTIKHWLRKKSPGQCNVRRGQALPQVKKAFQLDDPLTSQQQILCAPIKPGNVTKKPGQIFRIPKFCVGRKFSKLQRARQSTDVLAKSDNSALSFDAIRISSFGCSGDLL